MNESQIGFDEINLKNPLQSPDLIVQHQQQDDQQQWEDTIDPLKIYLDEVIGHGAFGAVHKGSYDGQTVVVKVLDLRDIKITKAQKEILKAHFKNEASLWENLDHPNITKMIGASMSMKTDSGHKNKKTIAESNFCIVSEYVKGGTLRSYLKKNQNRRLPMNVIIQFALDIAKGLSYLHSKKIIHCDVKPENMLLDEHQMIKLADFGESLLQRSENELMSIHSGTLGYMAPEVVSRKPYGPKCDVYAFGICLWEIYCCDMAYTYDLENIPEGIYKHIRPNIPVGCPRWLALLMEQCWDTDPMKRPEMKELVVELEKIRIFEEQQIKLENWSGCSCCQFLRVIRARKIASQVS